jgi:hypothetical protein
LPTPISISSWGHRRRAAKKSLERAGEAVADRLENRIDAESGFAGCEPFNCCFERIEVVRVVGDRDDFDSQAGGPVGVAAVAAQHQFGARCDGRFDLAPVEAVDRHAATLTAEKAGDFSGPLPALPGNAAQIDHIGPVVGKRAGEANDLCVSKARSVIDLRQDLDLVVAQVGRRRRFAEIVRQVVQVFGPSLERNVESAGQDFEIAQAPAGQDHAVSPFG